MSIKSRINHIRRYLLRSLTRYIGGKTIEHVSPGERVEIRRILISRPNNRLGNQVMVTPLLQEVSALFPDSKVDLFVRGGLPLVLFQNYPNIGNIIRLPKKPFKELFAYINVWITLRKYRYDLVINVDNNSSSGRLSTQFAKARFRFFCDAFEPLKEKYPDYMHMAKFPVYNLREYLPNLGIEVPVEPVPLMDIKLTPSEIEQGKKILDSMVDSGKKTISIYTYATGNKCYSKEWWAEFYRGLTDKFAATYNILEILPAENVSRIDFVAPSFYSMDIRQIGAVITNTSLYVGADCGITHLASAVKTPTVSLFSVTKPERYHPYGNGSQAVNTNTATISELIRVIENILSKQH